MANSFQYREAVKDRTDEKKLAYLRLTPGEDGGHTVEHHYAEDGLVLHKPKTHVFGKDEGRELLSHLVEHAGINLEDSGPESDED